MAGKRKRPQAAKQKSSPELNIMPFIDIFSMLNTFLLVSASFIGLGILEVQIPFLSNSPDVKEEPDRSLSIRVDVEEAQVTLTTQYTAEPIEKRVETYKLEEAGLERFHQDLIKLRQDVPEADKVTLYSDDEVKYDNLILVIDAIKTMKENEPPLNLRRKDGDALADSPLAPKSLYEKVVIGSVIL